MGLAEIQSALAQLYTSVGAREELRSDCSRFAEHYRLSNAEAETLADSVLNDAEEFASALARKRFAEAMKAIPTVEAILGAKLHEFFSAYARVTPLGSQRNPAFDALEFIRWILREHRRRCSLCDLDSLRYEEARILMRESNRRFLMRWLLVPGQESRQFVVWWRWGGRLLRWKSG